MRASNSHGLRWPVAGIPPFGAGAVCRAVSLAAAFWLAAGVACAAGRVEDAVGWAQVALFGCAARPPNGAAGVLACAVEAAPFAWADARLAEGRSVGGPSRRGDPAVPANQPRWLDRLFRLVSDSGAPPALAAGLAGLAVVDPPVALEAATAAAGALAITGAGKVAGGRVRPDALKTSGPADVRPEGGADRGAEAFLYTGPAGALAGGDARMSMPSGHAAGAVAVASVLARRYPGAAWAAYLWASAVSLSRVHLRRHWPTDVGAGAHLGRWWGRGP